MNELKKSAAEHFAVNPETKGFYVTSDGQCFTTPHDANEHSKSIGKNEEARKVVLIERSDVADEIAEIVGAAPKKGKK